MFVGILTVGSPYYIVFIAINIYCPCDAACTLSVCPCVAPSLSSLIHYWAWREQTGGCRMKINFFISQDGHSEVFAKKRFVYFDTFKFIPEKETAIHFHWFR